MRHFLADLENIREARIDLNKGFLELSLGDKPGEPFDSVNGLVLLQQAVIAFGSTIDGLDGIGEEALSDFRNSVSAFQKQLSVWKKSEVYHRPEQTVALRIAFDALERQADRVDLAAQRHLQKDSDRLDRRFVLTLGGSVLMLTIICLLVLHAAHIKDRLETAARVNAERFQEAVNVTQDGVWEWDLPSDTLYQSPSCWKMFGYGCDELGNKRQTFLSLVHPDDNKKIETAIQSCIKDETPAFEMEFRVKAKDGTWKWILGRGRVTHRDSEGHPQRMIGTSVDITERKKAEEALRESEAQFRSVFQVVSVGIAQVDPNTGQFIQFNKKYCEISGYSPEDLYAMPFYNLTHPEDRPHDSELFKNMISGKAPNYSNEKRYIRKDGKIVWVRLSASLIRDASGRPFRSVAICEDISERKKAEEERENLQEQLTQAQKMESVGRLAGGVAHDFNNMLGIILGHADLLRERMKETNPFWENVEEIRKASARAADLTRQLLAFARKQTVSPKVLDMNETVSSMLKMMRRLIGENIDLAWLPGPNLCAVKIDPSQVDQVLANLCVNARDAIEDVGKITIETRDVVFDEEYCRLHAGFVPGEYVLLAVSDNGCGMDKATQEKIFEPFFTTKEQGKGTGLGLATVYGVVRQNGGFINVYSEPGKGTTFRIYLQRSRECPEPFLVSDSLPEPKGQGEVILLVENDPALLTLATSMLLMEGYVVLAAETPTKALRVAEHHEGVIDLLMTDVIMPDMNGRELEANVRKLRPGIKCLYMSGYTANVIAHHGVLDPSVHFIPKPFSKRDMAVKVRSVLDMTQHG